MRENNKLLKDKRGRMYKMTSEGMLMKLSIEEGLKIEAEINRASIPVPYVNTLKQDRTPASSRNPWLPSGKSK